MGSAGWVRFEPTPGAPTTTSPSYTRVTAAEPTSSPSASASVVRTVGEAHEAPRRGADRCHRSHGRHGCSASRPSSSSSQGSCSCSPAPGLARRRRRLRSGDGEAAYREVVDTMVDLRLGLESSTPRSTLGAISALAVAGPGAESASGRGGHRADPAVGEWQRYGSPGAGPGRGPTWTSPPPRDPKARVARGRCWPSGRPASPLGTRPGALAGDMRIVRRALARRAGWLRRLVSVWRPPRWSGDWGPGGAGRGGSG